MPTIGDTFDVMAFGRFPQGRLRVRLDPAPRPTNATIEDLIEAEWTRRTAQAQRSGGLLFNGGLFRYVDHAVNGDSDAMTLVVGPSCYRDFVGTNLYNHHRVAELGWERFGNPIGTTATLTTADGCIVYGRRSDRVAYHAGHVHTFGGALEQQDQREDGRINAFDSLLRELREELSLTPDEFDPPVAVGLVRDREILQPELLFESRVRLTYEELIARWKTAESQDEHAELIRLDDAPEAIVPFIQTCGKIAPVAVAALLLHGRARWGQEWCDRALKRQLQF